ncbi:hypothetical protein PPYR_05174 [Photinus pyralis]|uniref:THAP-type domain-containing protein n=1 Tax=Photinus pyralis TaxID=7054 RepID=A0A5N4B0E6_PHOPY|nr:hypothetical protein PPYR_05174 [Photinus pyralis]
MIFDIKKKYALSTDALTILDSTFSGIPQAIMKRMLNNLRTKKRMAKGEYPKEIKSFAMTLQFYSSKAYNYVRKTFNIALPAPSTIRSWMAKVDCYPGFTKPLMGCLMLDEMAVKKEIQAEKHSQAVWGYVDVGTNVHIDNDREEATQALVLMIVGVNDNFKLPIGYFFIHSISGSEKANILREALLQLAYTGIVVLGITCDGPHVNFKMMQELGCRTTDVNNLKPYFENPVNNTKVYAVFDVCHMLKLVRNNWASSSVFLDPEGREIRWEFIDKLHHLQDAEGLYLGNKLRQKHVQWRKAIMKVNIAAQTLSNSVDLKLKDFENADATVKFIRNINDLYDILNSRNPFGKCMNTPLRASNEEYWRPRVENILEYLKNLKRIDGTPLYLTQKKVPFLGFIISAYSLLHIYDNEVKLNNSLKYVLTYKFSQDHLELFFCSIRCRNGSMNNPSCLQFYHTYRRMLMNIAVENNTGNCLAQDCTQLLPIDDILKEPDISEISARRRKDSDIGELEDRLEITIPVSLNEFSENVLSYISGFVVRSIKKHMSCTQCLNELETYYDDHDSSLQLIKRKSKGGLLYPTISVRQICKKIERKIQQTYSILGSLPSGRYLINMLMKESHEMLVDNNIFPGLKDHVFDYAPYEMCHKKTY